MRKTTILTGLTLFLLIFISCSSDDDNIIHNNIINTSMKSLLTSNQWETYKIDNYADGALDHTINYSDNYINNITVNFEEISSTELKYISIETYPLYEYQADCIIVSDNTLTMSDGGNITYSFSDNTFYIDYITDISGVEYMDRHYYRTR